MSSEACQALEYAKPRDLASAARIPGVTAAALSSVLLYTKKKVKKLFEENEKDFHIFNGYIRPSEDTIYKLKKFISILNEYQKKMNLIGKSTLPYIWTRHVLDSAQIEKILPKEDKNYITVDVGTGAGFPGIVLAALGRQDILLCEKVRKKNLFLNTVIKECKFKVKIYNDTIESLE